MLPVVSPLQVQLYPVYTLLLALALPVVWALQVQLPPVCTLLHALVLCSVVQALLVLLLCN